MGFRQDFVKAAIFSSNDQSRGGLVPMPLARERKSILLGRAQPRPEFAWSTLPERANFPPASESFPESIEPPVFGRRLVETSETRMITARPVSFWKSGVTETLD